MQVTVRKKKTNGKLNKSILYDTLKKPKNAKKLFTRLWALPNILYEL